ncbi:MAG TPA: hypothetical protein VFF09_00200 [archaeon]|nr:hypothetical protein [archaeon]
MGSKNLKVLFLFLVVYGLLYFLGLLLPLQDWAFTWDLSRLDYTLFLLPIPGFYFIYFLIPWMREELGFGDTFIYIFPLLFAAASYAAFVVAVYYFYGNQAFLNGVDISVFNIDYFDIFVKSSFIYFALAGIGGWGARVLIENFEEAPSKPKHAAEKK